MVNPLVERATSDLLVGPDWAKNSEICDILIHDPGQVKDVVKGIRRRIGSKSSKVQLLALTLLETLMNSCGDFVHMHVAERGVLRKMMKIAKRKRNYHVRETILMLIDNWQETFGPGSRYPQYYAAFHSLSRAGVVFPRRSDRRAPVFAPAQSESYTLSLQNPDHQATELPDDTDFPTLSMSEIQNARSIVDVLAEMLNGVEPGKEESVKQNVIIDLVQQCRTYKQRVLHLINSTAEESLLSEGLALNDDLQKLLAKHETIASGTSAEPDTKPAPLQALIDIDEPAATTDDSNVKALTTTLASQSSIDPGIDLMSWGDTSAPPAEGALALVPVGEVQESSLESHPNNAEANSLDPQSTHPNGEAFHEQNVHGPPHGVIYPDGSAQYYPQNPSELSDNGPEGSNYFPPPPWETQSADGPQPQTVHPYYYQDMQGQHPPHTMHPHYQQEMQAQHAHQAGMYAQSPLPPHSQYPPMNSHQLAAMHQQMGMVGQGENTYYNGVPNNSHPQYLEQRMYGLAITDPNAAHGVQYQSAPGSSHMRPSMRPKQEDKLFGDLVNLAKSKQRNSSTDSLKSI